VFHLCYFSRKQKIIVILGRSSGSPGFLHLPAFMAVALDSDTVYRLTAAGTAPALHRIPFSFPFREMETEIPKFRSKIAIIALNNLRNQ
jgi:hypothetical protein